MDDFQLPVEEAFNKVVEVAGKVSGEEPLTGGISDCEGGCEILIWEEMHSYTCGSWLQLL